MKEVLQKRLDMVQGASQIRSGEACEKNVRNFTLGRRIFGATTDRELNFNAAGVTATPRLLERKT